MSAANALIADIALAGGRLRLIGRDGIKVEAPTPLSADLVDRLRAHKPELIAALAAIEERAAIVENDGGVPRDWAEGFARLHPDQTPADVPATRWRVFVDDVGRFLDSGWPARCVSLGWGPADLFGCDPAKPWAAIDRMGLLWLVGGGRVVALSECVATIAARSGARLTYRRTMRTLGRVLAWELMRHAQRPHAEAMTEAEEDGA